MVSLPLKSSQLGVRDLFTQFSALCSTPGTEEGIQKTFVESLINSSTQQIFVEHLSASGTVLCPKGTSVNQINMNS